MIPPFIYSQPCSPTPSTAAVAPEFLTQKRSPAKPPPKKIKKGAHLQGKAPQTADRIRLQNEDGFCGAGDRARTGTVLPPRDFKSLASANSATPAYLLKKLIFKENYNAAQG